MELKEIAKTFYFIRGLSRESRHWGNFLDVFSQKFKVKVKPIELPGVGYRYKEKCPNQIADIVDDLRKNFHDTDQPIGIISISMGGMIALDWAHRFPKEISHLCLINSSASNLSSINERLTWKAIGTIPSLLFMKDLFSREKKILELTCQNRESINATAKLYAEYANEFPVSKKNFFNQLHAASVFKVPNKLSGCNLVILNSENDQLVNPLCSLRLAENFQVELFTNKKAGHDLVYDDPAWIIEVLKNKWT